MWISYDLSSDIRLTDFGIEVPLDDERARDILRNLKKKGEQFDLSNENCAIDFQDISLVHDKAFIEQLKNNVEQTIYDAFELKDASGNWYRYNPNNAKFELDILFQRILRQASGLYKTAEMAVKKNSAGFFLGAGMHHSMSDGGRGFCLINDIVISLRKLKQNSLIKTAWVIDTDAHKGDGTAQITLGDDSISTLSIHMKNGWPLNQDPLDSRYAGSFVPSTIDIPMAVNEEEFYLERLQKGLLQLENDFVRPDICIVVSGSDPWEEDGLPSSQYLRLQKEELLMRDKLVYEFLKARSIPQTWCLAGGYGRRAYEIPLQFLNTVH